MSRVPNGVPTVTYCRLMPSTVSMSQGDIMADGNAVVVLEPGQPSSRFEVAQVLDKSHSDEEICDLTFGSRAGAGLGAVLNPVAAFVNDAANVVIMLTGSRMTKKWQFLKRCFLPFIANEILTSIAERSQQAPNNFYKAQLTLSTFEIHDEVIGDLLRPANRGLPIVNTLEDGVVVQGLHKETIVDEVTLRRLLAEACDNRATYGLPVGGNIDTSTGVFEFRLYQAEPQGQGQNVFQTQECYSKLTIIDVPSMDPLASTNPEEVRLLSGPTLHKSLLSLIEVCKKLNNPYRAQLAPFRSSKLTHFLSEMLGGNAIVVALAQVCSGEPQVSRRTLDFVSYLNSAVHYPMGAREFSDTIRGLLGKYRAMLMHLSDELHATANTSSSNTEHQTALITKLQGELAKSVTEMNGALEDRARIFEMSELLKAKYNTLMEEKLKQADDLAQSEEDNIALAKEVVEHELAHAQAMEQAEKEKLGLQGEIVTLEAQVDSLTADVTDYKEKCCKLEKQVVGDAKEVASKQTQIDDLFQQLQTKTSELNQQREKNIELGAELLTLVNHKDVLHKDLDELQTKNKNIDTVLAEHQSRHQEAELEIRKLLEKLVSKDEEIIELRKFKYMKQGKDNTASTASLEQPDPTNPAVVKAVESMRQAVDQKKERQFAKQIQSLERQLRRMEADFQGAKKERDQAVKEVIELRSKYRSLLQDTYNSAQQGQQPDSTVEKEYGGMDAQFNDADDPLEVLHIHHNLQSLLASYQNHETVLEDSYGQAVQTRQEAIEAYRQLYDHYRHSLDMVEDMMSIVQDGKYSGTTGSGTGRDSKDTSGGGKKMQLEARAKKILEESLAEQFQFGSTVIPNAERLLNEMEDPRSKFGKRDLPGLDKDRNDVDMKERIAAVIGTYQHSLQLTENKLAHAMQENMELKVKVKQLLSSNPASMSKISRHDTESHTAKPEAVTDFQYKQAIDQQTSQLTQQYKVMYENLSKEIFALKNELVTTKQREQSLQQALSRGQSQNVSRVPSAVGEPGQRLDAVLGKDAAVTSSRAQDIIADVLEKKHSVPMLTLPSVWNDAVGSQRQQQESLVIQTPHVQQVTAMSSTPPPENHHHQHHQNQVHHHNNTHHALALKKLEEEKQQLKTQLMLSEQRAAQMTAQQVSLQEELAAYQAYMKDILPQYQKMLQQQKKTAQGLSNSLLVLNSGGGEVSGVGGLRVGGVGGGGIGSTAARPSMTSMAAAKEVLRSNSNSNMK